ncbi:unnamed protein product [Pylaiella littoralis]
MHQVSSQQAYLNHLLAEAVRHGSTQMLHALFSDAIGSIDLNAAVHTAKDWTLLMLAASHGHSEIASILLDNGASTSITCENGFSALYIAARGGHLAVTETLIEAGADLEARPPCEFPDVALTPLFIAMTKGHTEVVRALIKAGGDPNTRCLDGITMLSRAAGEGYTDIVRILLRGGANPLLTGGMPGLAFVPLDVAASKGQVGVVRELLQQVGVEGCGGASGGKAALHLAARGLHMEIMVNLMEAGVVDTGVALKEAANNGSEAVVKLLLQQREKILNSTGRCSRLDVADFNGRTPLLNSISSACYSSSRIVRLLVDSGVDTLSTLRFKDAADRVIVATPLAVTTRLIEVKQIRGKEATKKQLQNLEATRRFLLQVEACRSVCWSWRSDVNSIARAITEDRHTAKMVLISPTSMFPILRPRARRRGVLVAALSRYSGKA